MPGLLHTVNRSGPLSEAAWDESVLRYLGDDSIAPVASVVCLNMDCEMGTATIGTMPVEPPEPAEPAEPVE